MMLNPANTTLMLITTASKHRTLINNSTHLDLHINGVAIETVKEQKLLGITIHYYTHVILVATYQQNIYYMYQFLISVQLFGAKIFPAPINYINYMLAL